jgi:hypothetical protein
MTDPLKPNESPDSLAGQSLGAAHGSAAVGCKDEVLKRCDGCGQVVMVSRKLTNHGRLKPNGAGEFFPCGTLYELKPSNAQAER